MKSLFRWLSSRNGQNPVNSVKVHGDIETLLERRRKALLDADPETGVQWRSLESAVRLAETKGRVHQPLSRTRPRRVGVVLAASAIAVAIALVLWPRGESPVIYQTARGQVSTITLGDGTDVILNHTSSLTVDGGSFTNDRYVRLKGEAFFRVRKNGMPFTVSTAIGEVHVLGTEFDVRDRDGELAVGVVKGKVNVSATREGRDSAVTILGGEFTTCASSGFPQSPVRLTESRYPGWMYGRISFVRASIASVCDEIEAKFDVAIRVESPNLSGKTITGELEASSVTAALSTLTQLTGTHVRHENGTYILY